MKRSLAVLAAALAAVASLILTGAVSAHAPITYIEWDTDTNPSRLIASTNNREMVAEPGSFYVRVYNSSGARVDTGEAVMTPDRLEIHVVLLPNLPPGTYRVDWLTTSTDGEVLSGSESLPLPGSFGEPPTAPEPEEEHEEGEEHEGEEMTGGEPVAPPSTGDAGLLEGRSTPAGPFAVVAAVLATAGSAALVFRRGS
jgi:methionine-rich copper-binding protein CopC